MKINSYFNDSCKICRTEINHYKKINKTIHWVDVIRDKNALIDTNLSKKDLIRRLHIIKNNRVFKGLDAFLIVWGEIPRYKILAKFASIPVIYHLGWLIYEFIALILFYKNRRLLQNEQQL